MSVLLNETRVSLSKLAEEQRVHCSTVWRWALRGVGGHRLECFSLGGRRYTTREAFGRWVGKLNGPVAVSNPILPDRERTIDAAERDLDAMLHPSRPMGRS